MRLQSLLVLSLGLVAELSRTLNTDPLVSFSREGEDSGNQHSPDWRSECCRLVVNVTSGSTRFCVQDK